VVQEDLPQVPAELETELIKDGFLRTEVLKQIRGEAPAH
jgi:hypothetical protein